MQDVRKNEGDVVVHYQQFMGGMRRVKADLSRVSWNDWGDIFKKNKKFLAQICLTRVVNKIPVTYCKFWDYLFYT